MTDDVSRDPSTDAPSESPLNRRLLLRGGALVAGATAVAAVSQAAFPRSANAADGDELLAGSANTASSTTSLTVSPASATTPALTLTNASGPTLRLTSIGTDFGGSLPLGAIVNTDLGPFIGVDYGDGPEVDFLATGSDLEGLPRLSPVGPTRLLDTRTDDGRARIVRQSSGTAITSTGKLRGGQWIDIAIALSISDFELSAIFGNATVASAEANGYLVVYPATPVRPDTSNVNYVKNVSIANSVFVGVGELRPNYVVRLFSTATARVIFDLSGVIVGAPGPDADRAGARGGVRAARAARFEKKRQRMKKSLSR